jgi:hypothetical protein
MAQVAIVALAPESKAQVRVPPPTPSILPITVTTIANANGEVGGGWSPISIVETGPGISTTRFAAELLGDGGYADVFAPGGDLEFGADGKTITVTYPTLSSSEPLFIQPLMFAGGAGILREQVQLGITDIITITKTFIAQPTPPTIQLFYRQPSLIQPTVISATWGVAAPLTVVTKTLVTGQIQGGLYSDVISDRGHCNLTISGFNCTIEPLARGDSGRISVTLETLKAPLMTQFLNVEAGSESLVFSHTTTVQQLAATEPRPVGVDVRPGNRRNVVNPKSNGLLRVAILSDPSLDVAAEIDQASLRVGRTGSEDSVAFCMSRDENHDGLVDLRCFIHMPSTGLQPGDTELVVTGFTLDGTPILGRDSILTVPRR